MQFLEILKFKTDSVCVCKIESCSRFSTDKLLKKWASKTWEKKMFLDSLGIGKSILFKVYKCFVIYGKLLGPCYNSWTQVWWMYISLVFLCSNTNILYVKMNSPYPFQTRTRVWVANALNKPMQIMLVHCSPQMALLLPQVCLSLSLLGYLQLNYICRIFI